MTNTTHMDRSSASTSEARAPVPVVELVLGRIRLRARRRAAWLAHLAGKRTGDIDSLDHPALSWWRDEQDTPEEEAEWYGRAEQVQSLNHQIARIEEELSRDAESPLEHLCRLFSLCTPEMDLLQVCLGQAIDPSLQALYCQLLPNISPPFPTETLAARLFGYGRRPLWNPEGPLAVWGLVRSAEAGPGEPLPLSIDPVVRDWILGSLITDAPLVGLIQGVAPREPLESWPLDEMVQAIQGALTRQIPIRVLITGPPASGRRTCAASIAGRLGIQTLSVDTSTIQDNAWPELALRAQRLAVLGNLALIWHGSHLHRPWPATAASGPIQFVACEGDQDVASGAHAVTYRLDLPAPTLQERRRLWSTACPTSATWAEEERETLATRYRLSAGDIVSIGLRSPATAAEAAACARELTRYRLGELGRLLDAPFDWDDLAVPEGLREALEDFAFEAHDRTGFWESSSARRLYPRGTGLIALFSGPPGTGKTMAAQIVAADLQLDLFRIDLASVISKYIGETAKHLGRIFSRAARMNAVLLFDEADALFSKRTEIKDAHDRYANADTSYLLQLLEEYHGVVILATNKRQQIDPAFTRRIRYIFEFPRPDAVIRQRIWRRVLDELYGQGLSNRLEPAIHRLAAGIDLSGAQIKNAALASIFVSRRRREPLAPGHLLRGIERELAKEGRTLGSRERERILHDA